MWIVGENLSRPRAHREVFRDLCVGISTTLFTYFLGTLCFATRRLESGSEPVLALFLSSSVQVSSRWMLVVVSDNVVMAYTQA